MSKSKRLQKRRAAEPKEILKIKAIRNNTDPLLLRLPAELRGIIWQYALGGNILHICPFSAHAGPSLKPFGVYCCTDPNTDKSKADQVQGEGLELTKFRYGQHHAEHSCNVSKPWLFPLEARFNPGLLLASRQIYAETRLLPFQLNNFSFLGPPHELAQFCSQLTEEQRRAVRSVTLVSIEGLDHESPIRASLSTLHGLKDLMIFGHCHLTCRIDQGIEDQCILRALRALKTPLLSKAKICLTRKSDGWRDFWSYISLFWHTREHGEEVKKAGLRKLRDWSRDMERRLKGVPDKEEEASKTS